MGIFKKDLQFLTSGITNTLCYDFYYDRIKELNYEDYYIDYLRTLPKDQIEDIKKNGPDPLEIICRNCGSIYKIPVEKI